MKRHFIFQINADNKGGPVKKFVWTLSCLIQATYWSTKNFSLAREPIYVRFDSKIKDFRNTSLSPVRLLTDEFLENSIYLDSMQNHEINFLEIGCGNHLAIDYLPLRIMKKILKFTGVDPAINDITLTKYPFNNSRLPAVNLLVSEIEDIDLESIAPDVIFSHSVLEHIKLDFELISQLCNHAETNSKSTLQMHFVPSGICFINYFFHGYRQYTLASLIELKKRLNLDLAIIGLGNRDSNIFYFEQKLQKLFNKFRLPIKSAHITKISEVLSSKLGHFPSYYCLVIRHKSEGSSLPEKK
jgi:hypothetical protein